MAATLKYNFRQINDIASSGFHFEIPEDTYSMINYLSQQVGSVGLSSSIFSKTDKDGTDSVSKDNSFSPGHNNSLKNKKRKGNKSMEISTDEWETIRTFQATKLEQNSGIDGDIDQIRMMLNKLTDKTFLDMREKLTEKINSIFTVSITPEDSLKIGNIIYDLSSSNKFYSKIFADLFAELATQYDWLMAVFNEKYDNLLSLYNNIVYIDSEKDYDGFCDMNKKNDKRRANTTFFMNLASNGFISIVGLVRVLKQLLELVYNMIDMPNKKNEVDELTENIAILFNKDMIDCVEKNSDNLEELYINGQSIFETVNILAKSKAKDHQSLSNKTIFKFMDLVEM
jgi:hypothetical protein